jgi:hypothetical protein
MTSSYVLLANLFFLSSVYLIFCFFIFLLYPLDQYLSVFRAFFLDTLFIWCIFFLLYFSPPRADCQGNVGPLTSHNPMGLHGPLQG